MRLRTLTATALCAVVGLTGSAGLAQATPAQERQIAKQARTITVLKKKLAEQKRATVAARRKAARCRLGVVGQVRAMTPEEAWSLVPVLAGRLSGDYSSTVFVSNDDYSDYTAWTLTRSVYTGP